MGTEEQEKQDDDSVSLKGPGGWGVSARGPQTIIALLVVVVLGAGYLHHQYDQASQADGAAQHQKIEQKFDELSYILTRSQADREKLNLEMPPSLRAKTHRRRKDLEDD